MMKDKPIKVLLIEDNPEVASLLEEITERKKSREKTPAKFGEIAKSLKGNSSCFGIGPGS